MAKVIIIIIIIFYGIMIGAFVFCFLVFHSLMIIIQKICACYLKPHRSRLKLWMRESVERLKGKCWFHSRYTKYNNTVFMSQVLDQCVQFSLCKQSICINNSIIHQLSKDTGRFLLRPNGLLFSSLCSGVLFQCFQCCELSSEVRGPCIAHCELS